MDLKFYPRDYFKEKMCNEERDTYLDSLCCDVFNAASQELLESANIDATFSSALAEEFVRRAGSSAQGEGTLIVVSSRFASEFQSVFERFGRVLYCGLARLPPEECLHYTAQFYEAACLTQSHLGPPENAVHRARWTERETLSNIIERVSSRLVNESYFLTENQARLKRLLKFGLSQFCRCIVSTLMRIAYAEDRATQCKSIHYAFFLLRDITEETLRHEEVEIEEKEDKKKVCRVA